MRIGIFNVKYSPNLGDGIIAECLEATLRSLLPGAAVFSMDLAGREDYGQGLDRSRSVVLPILQSLPGAARRVLMETILGFVLRRRLQPRWRRRLADCDAVILGGGQLIADADLNFPLKLSAAAAEGRRLGLPIAVFAVGVAPQWSERGRKLLQSVFSPEHVAHVAVRDERSRENLTRLLGRSPLSPSVCRDPGLLASEVYPHSPGQPGAAPVVGLGITHPAVLRHHAEEPTQPSKDMIELYAEIVRALLRAGYHIVCFTNGSGEDEECLAATRARLGSDHLPGGRLTFAERPRRPSDLARLIAGVDAVLAHRLHANILAYAYAKPHLGFRWDAKLPAFFDSVGRSEYAISLADTPPDTVIPLLRKALHQGIDAATHAAVVAETRESIRLLAYALCAAVTACGLMGAPVARGRTRSVQAG